MKPKNLPNTQADIEASLVAEYRSLQRQLQVRAKEFDTLKATLENYEKQEKPRRNKRYSVEFSVTPANVDELAFQKELTSFFSVDKNTRFHCAQIENTIRIQGTVGSTNLLLSLPNSQFAGVFDYDLRIFDTGSDREWFITTAPTEVSAVGVGGSNNFTSGYAPNELLMSGLLSGLHLPRHAILAGGTEVSVGVRINKAVDTIYSRGPYETGTGAPELFTDVNEYIVQISFIGHEEAL